MNAARTALVMLLAAVAPAVAVGGTHTVSIEGMKYHPATISVKPGDVVVWRNNDVVPHTVTAAGKFDSGQIAAGASWSWTATKGARIEYVCTYHPGMKAVVLMP